MHAIHLKILALGLLAAGITAPMQAQDFTVQTDGTHLTYVADARGNRLLDYSTCGYRNSNVDIPNADNVVFVSCQPGDNSERIQRALDHVATLTPGANGLRGAVLLGKGKRRPFSSRKAWTAVPCSTSRGRTTTARPPRPTLRQTTSR